MLLLRALSEERVNLVDENDSRQVVTRHGKQGSDQLFAIADLAWCGKEERSAAADSLFTLFCSKGLQLKISRDEPILMSRMKRRC